MPDVVTILADLHEHRSGVPLRLRALGADVKVVALPAADYVPSKNVLVERKTVSDLHDSIVRGRFWLQMGKTRAPGVWPYLLIEGPDLDRGPLAPSSVRGACLAVLEQGITLLRTTDGDDTALWIYRLALRGRRRPRPDRPA
ncbi:MAG: hypothetical protein H0U03_09600 [Actinobacteria bacterium]|nr:hypothetical protein [Actinomycetota bacterium]